MIYIIVCPTRAEVGLDHFEVFVVKLLPLFRVVEFEYFECSHHFAWLDFVCVFGEHGRDDDLEVGADRDEGVAVVHVDLREMMIGLFVDFVHKLKLLFLHISIVFECIFYYICVVYLRLMSLVSRGEPAVLAVGLGGVVWLIAVWVHHK